jgi:hypothetical protein
MGARGGSGVVHEADLAQRADPEVRAEVRRWTRRGTASVDGIPENALGPTPRDPRGLVRDFAMGERVEGRASADFAWSPQLAVLLTADDDQEAWLRAGQALEAVWLELTASGWGVSLLTQPLEVSILRWLARPLTAPVPRDRRDRPDQPDVRAAWPQVILRIGRETGWTPPTPRRPLGDVLRFADPG